MSSQSQDFEYFGSELELFADAVNWRRYWQGQISRYIGHDVLEVGAGIGTTTRDLAKAPVNRWVALEPDATMAARLLAERKLGRLPVLCEPRCGTTASLGADERFDTVLYIDVLEHIEDDYAEIARVTQHLVPGGHLIVLVPAHQALYTPFDAAIGHFRRYSRARLLEAGPAGSELRVARYLDSVGLAATLGNRLVLRSAQPTRGQIQLWDRVMVRLSRGLDPLTGYHLGKTVIAVWRVKGAKSGT